MSQATYKDTISIININITDNVYSVYILKKLIYFNVTMTYQQIHELNKSYRNVFVIEFYSASLKPELHKITLST